MLTFTANLPKIRLLQGTYTKEMDRIIGQIFREAAREWLRAFLLEGVPVETGMAKAGLQPLGRFLRVAVPISPKRKPYYSKLEGGRQSIGLGHDKSRFFLKDDRTNPLEFVHEFEWSSEILHYYLKEFYNGTSQAGEEAIVSAETAFIAHLEDALVRRLPKLEEYVDFETQYTFVSKGL